MERVQFADSLLILSDQNFLYRFAGDSFNDSFGASVGGAGDVNGDGYADVIVGAPEDDNTAGNSGSARVFSGVNGSVLFTFDGNSASDKFGSSVSGAGDVNGDGYADLIVGAPADDNAGALSGSAAVLSGANGTVLYTMDGDASLDQFGWSVSGAGDVNADGYADFIVGAITDDSTGVDSGSARVFSGVNGAALYTLNGNSAGDQFGVSVGNAGDVNADGYGDLIVGAYTDDAAGANSGSAQVFSGANGSIIHTFNGESVEDRFGWSVSGAGDTNGDGYADLIVGGQLVAAGSARVFSGVNGAVLSALDGVAVSGAGDVNADGYADLVVGSPLDGGVGAAQVASGTPLSLTVDTHELSVSLANTQTMTLDAGVANALQNYWVFTGFAASGDTPGVTMAPGVVIPLNQPDPLTSFVIGLTQLGGGAPTFVGWKGALGLFGKALPSLHTFGPTPVALGVTLHHAALVYTADGCGAGCDTFQLATNWVPMTTVP